MKPVHKSPRFVFSEQLNPCGNVEVPGPGGARIGHSDTTAIVWIEEIIPGVWAGQTELFSFRSVETYGTRPSIDPDPGRRIIRVSELWPDFRKVGRGIRCEQPLLFQPHHRCCGKTPNRVTPFPLLGEQSGRDDARRIFLPDDVEVCVLSFNRLLQCCEVVRLKS